MGEAEGTSRSWGPERSRWPIPAPCVVVIFGASGDLAARKLVPALYYLAQLRMLPASFSIIGCGRTPFSHDQFRDRVCSTVREHLRLGNVDDDSLRVFCQGVFYVQGDYGQLPAYAPLRALLEQLDRERGTGGNRLFYLATPPSFFPLVVRNLGATDLARSSKPGQNWVRIVVEKPFGRDLATARELNHLLANFFDEDRVYRIDHYLGKETVQNLVVFRFANGIFEPVWNRRYIDHVQIAVAEDIGIEGRGSYYEESGLLRDMVQNHVLQLLCLVAMEPPARFEATAVRDEKAKVLRSIRAIAREHVAELAVRGQYMEGRIHGQVVPAYRAEAKVSPVSLTETFAALRLFIDNWRWAGVPFYVRSGKRLAKQVSEITVQFRDVPHLLFEGKLTGAIAPALLSLRLQPDEGIALQFNAKLPGATLQIRPVKMDFRYAQYFGASPPTAYETLLLDCMLGDSTLFNRADAVELSWELLMPVLERWQEDGARGLAFYPAGSWGPKGADDLLARDGRRWHTP